MINTSTKNRESAPGSGGTIANLLTRRILRQITFGLLLLLLLLLAALPASAQDSSRVVTDDEVNAIAKELYCPICESTPLDVCSTQACADWREVIRTKLSEGQTEEEIKNYFLELYGPRALAEPPRSGITQFLWILPIIVVVTGGFLLYLYMRGSAKKTQAPTTVSVSAQEKKQDSSEAETGDEDYRSRIERELREM
jgi:cytochrome c-type biogenesis protein CcmH